MTSNDTLAAEYGDLLEDGPDAIDAELLPLIAALDALYAAPVPQALRTRLAQPAFEGAGSLAAAGDGARAARELSANAQGASRRLVSLPARPTARARPHRLQGFAALAAAVLVVALMAAVLHALAPSGAGNTGGEAAQQRFARTGGLRIVLSDAGWSLPAGVSVNARAIFRAEEPLLSHRFTYAMGVGAPIFSQSDNDHLVIELPGVGEQQAQEVRALLASGQVDVYLTITGVPVGTEGEGVFPGVQAFTSDDVDPASVAAQTDPQSGAPIVALTLNPAQTSAFARLTADHIGDYLTAYLDSTAVMSAVLQSQISGPMQIVGFSTVQAARNFAAFLKYGHTQPNGIVSMTYVAPQR